MGVPLLNPTTGEVREYASRDVSSRLQQGWVYADSDQRIPFIIPSGGRDPITGRPRGWVEGTVESRHANELVAGGAVPLTPRIWEQFRSARSDQTRRRMYEAYAEHSVWSPLEWLGTQVDRVTGLGNLVGVDTRLSSLMAPVSANIGEALFDQEFTSEDVEEALRERRAATPVATLLAELQADIAGAFIGAGAARSGASLLPRLGMLAGPEALASGVGVGATRGLASVFGPSVRAGTISAATARSLANTAGLGVEGGASAIANLVLRSQLEDTDLSTSQIISDGSMGALLGLNLGHFGGMLGRGLALRRAVPTGGDEVINEPRNILNRTLVDSEQLTTDNVRRIQELGGEINEEVLDSLPRSRWDTLRRFTAGVSENFNAVSAPEQRVASHPAVLRLAADAPTEIPRLAGEMEGTLQRAAEWQRNAVETLAPQLSDQQATRVIGTINEELLERRLSSFLTDVGADIQGVLRPTQADAVRFTDTGRMSRAQELYDSLMRAIGHRENQFSPARARIVSRTGTTPGAAYNQLRTFRNELARQVVDPTAMDAPTRSVAEHILRRTNGILEDANMFGALARHEQALRETIPELDRRLTALRRELAAGDPTGLSDENIFSRNRLDTEFRSVHRPGGADALNASIDYLDGLEVATVRLSQTAEGAGIPHAVEDDILRLSQQQTRAVQRAKSYVNAQYAVNKALEDANQGSGFKPELAILAGFALGGVSGALLGSTLTFLQRPTAAFMRLHNLRRSLAGWSTRRSSAVNKLTQRVRAAAEGRRFTSPGAMGKRALLVPVVDAASYEEKVEQFQAVREHVETLLSNPEMFAEHLAVMTAGFGTVSAAHQAEAQMQAWRALEYLGSKMPAPGSNRLTMKDRMKPSAIQLSIFTQALSGIEDPMSLYDDIANFRLTQEKAKAVGYVYPRLMQIVAQDMASVVAELVADEVNVPYQFRIQLGVLTGAPTDDTLTPNFLRISQSNYAQTTQQDTVQRSYTRRPVTPEHTLTETQEVESRL